MPVKILLPALSPTMTEGTLAKWLKKEGEEAHSGDIVAEVETDKATMEIEAIEDGKLGRILIAEGTEGVPINTPIALILEEGEDDSALDTVLTSEADALSPKAVDVSNVKLPKSNSAAEELITAPDAVKSGARIFASPLAKKMARQAGLYLAQISGSGPNGRIVKADIE